MPVRQCQSGGRQTKQPETATLEGYGAIVVPFKGQIPRHRYLAIDVLFARQATSSSFQ
jgi:hypothetical protein